MVQKIIRYNTILLSVYTEIYFASMVSTKIMHTVHTMQEHSHTITQEQYSHSKRNIGKKKANLLNYLY